MYLIVIAWMYVVVMMTIAEATSSNGTLLGALITFVLYGLGPVALVVYLMGAPGRSKAIKKRDAQAHARQMALNTATTNPPALSVEPDASGHSSGGAESITGSTGIPPVGKEP